jgi:hypothetical protein
MSSPVPSEAQEDKSVTSVKQKSGRNCNLGATEILGRSQHRRASARSGIFGYKAVLGDAGVSTESAALI